MGPQVKNGKHSDALNAGGDAFDVTIGNIPSLEWLQAIPYGKSRIQHTVVAERDAATVVIERWLRDIKQPDGWKAAVTYPIVGRLTLHNGRLDLSSFSDLVLQKVPPVALVVRMENDTHHALVFADIDFRAKIDEQLLPRMLTVTHVSPYLGFLVFNDCQLAGQTWKGTAPNGILKDDVLGVNGNKSNRFGKPGDRNCTATGRKSHLYTEPK